MLPYFLIQVQSVNNDFWILPFRKLFLLSYLLYPFAPCSVDLENLQPLFDHLHILVITIILLAIVCIVLLRYFYKERDIHILENMYVSFDYSIWSKL